MGGFSKVTHFLRDTLLTGDRDLMMSSELTISQPQPPANLAVNSLSEAGFELVTTVSNSLITMSV